MNFYECKELTVFLLQYMPREEAIDLCQKMSRYILARKNTTGYSFTGNLPNNYYFRLEDDDILSEYQKRIVIYQTLEKPICIIVGQPIAILREFLVDLESYLKNHSQKELDQLTAEDTNLSFYSLVRQVNLLVDSNNDTFSRAAFLAQQKNK